MYTGVTLFKHIQAMEKQLRVLILYHSASGNTAWVARRIGEALQERTVNTTLCSIAAHPDLSGLSDYDIVGFGCPVMAFQPSFSMRDFIRLLPATADMPSFVFTTYSGLLANSTWSLSKLLMSRGFTTIAHAHFRAEVSWPIMRYARMIMGKGRPDGRDLGQIEVFTETIIARMRERASGRMPAAREVSFNPLNIFYYIGRLSRPDALRALMGSKKVDLNKCTRCGLCRDVCAAGAISLDPYPLFSNRCNGCWGCYNICAEGAITTIVPACGRYHVHAEALTGGR